MYYASCQIQGGPDQPIKFLGLEHPASRNSVFRLVHAVYDQSYFHQASWQGFPQPALRPHAPILNPVHVLLLQAPVKLNILHLARVRVTMKPSEYAPMARAGGALGVLRMLADCQLVAEGVRPHLAKRHMYHLTFKGKH